MRLAGLLGALLVCCGSPPASIQSAKYEVTAYWEGSGESTCYSYVEGYSFTTVWDFQRVGERVWTMRPLKADNMFIGYEDKRRVAHLQWGQVREYYTQDMAITMWPKPAVTDIAGSAQEILTITLPDEEEIVCDDQWSIEGTL